MTATSIRRFWREATVVPHAEGCAVALDGKVALTPARAALATVHRRLAEAVAGEWRDAPETLKPEEMPLTGYLNAVVDRVEPNKEALGRELARFADHELICYRADGPPALVQRQAQGWDPVINWIRDRYDATLATGAGILHIPQSDETLARLTKAVQGLDAYRLAAALKLSGITKSLALTLAAVEGWRTPQEAYALSRIDETFQAEQWGEDAEAARRVAKEMAEIGALAQYLALLDEGRA
jgi:chaperone required for assembly of F1-ATPase